MFALIRGGVVQGASGPSAPILHTDGGWAGFILDNTQGNASISITALGRYKVPVSFQPDLGRFLSGGAVFSTPLTVVGGRATSSRTG